MTAARFMALGCEPATCRCEGAADRGSATRLLSGRFPVPDIRLPDPAAVDPPGRVHGLGRFADRAIDAALAAALPESLRGALRPDFEWYACRGAFFHNDAHYGDVLFGAWCFSGPPREIVFSRARARVPAAPADWAVFDPFEPHAVLEPGAWVFRREHYADAPPSLFLGFELRLDADTRQAFGIGPPRRGASVLSSRVAIHAETGAMD